MRIENMGAKIINSDPSERTNGDVTQWTYHLANSLELSNVYADDSLDQKTYDAFNCLSTLTDARGVVKTHTYDGARGLLLSESYSDETNNRTYVYNFLAILVQISDDAGVRNLAYNSYNELETGSLVADSVTHLVTELRDNYGRSVGYTYAKNGSVQQTVSTGYGVNGRVSTAAFVHGGATKQFNYAYLNGTNLLQTLTMPNNMTLTQGFEEKCDLLTQMDYKRGNTLVSRRVYTYDALGRPLTRQTSRNGQTINDSFVHSYRSELASAQVNGQTYAYDYDNIGNRRMSIDASDYAFYDANELNQYSSIRKNEETAFVPTFDTAGNQTLVKTATGIWTVSYNAENRPIIFQKNTDSVTTRITCTYDYMGRRATKKVEEITTDAEGNESSTLISHHRFIYRGYLQIACCDLTRANHPCLWLITWDPTQPVATRPLAIQKDGTWYTYGWDLTKNICEIFGKNGYIRSTYTYSPFGSVTTSGDVEQPIQWSSEYYDNELALVYYNYRHYNPTDGRWINRDPIAEQGGWNLYNISFNNTITLLDILGLEIDDEGENGFIKTKTCHRYFYRKTLKTTPIEKIILGFLHFKKYEIKVLLQYKTCKGCCLKTLEKGKSYSGAFAAQVEVEGGTKTIDLIAGVLEFGAYVRTGVTGNIGLSYNTCSDNLNATGCLNLYIEGGLLVKTKSRIGKIEAGGRGGINFRGSICAFYNNKNIIFKMRGCVSLRARAWAKMTFFGKNIGEIAYEYQKERCSNWYEIYRLHLSK